MKGKTYYVNKDSIMDDIFTDIDRIGDISSLARDVIHESDNEYDCLCLLYYINEFVENKLDGIVHINVKLTEELLNDALDTTVSVMKQIYDNLETISSLDIEQYIDDLSNCADAYYYYRDPNNQVTNDNISGYYMDLFDLFEKIALELLENEIGLLPNIKEIYIRSKELNGEEVNEKEIRTMLLW
ncbi:MAG: hypothetical protein IJ232_02350 [Lachnospiraceae bacterium]|nr:hypothetical protein [Lachnospiraceae bacterium]